MQEHTLYELDRILLAALEAARSGHQPSAPWLSRAAGGRVERRRRQPRRLFAPRPRPTAAVTPAADAGCS